MKALIDPLFPAVNGSHAVYLDFAPPDAPSRYAVIGGATLPKVPGLNGDAHVLAFNHPIQLDVWQARTAEDDALVPQVIARLDGARPSGVIALRFDFSIRTALPPMEGNWVRDAVTFRAYTTS